MLPLPPVLNSNDEDVTIQMLSSSEKDLFSLKPGSDDVIVSDNKQKQLMQGQVCPTQPIKLTFELKTETRVFTDFLVF